VRALGAGAALLAALLAVALPSRAAEPGAQNPAPVNAFELEAGRRFDRLPGGQDESVFRLSYRGQLVRAEGTPFKYASGLDLAAPALPASAGAAGDRHQWSLKYDDRRANLGGSLLEAEGVQPIVLGGIEKLDLRGTAAIATNDLGTHVAVGLESPPFRIPGLAGREISNWLVLGVNAQRSPGQALSATSSGSQDRTLVTYRAFVGKAFGWRKSASMGATAQRLEKEILKQAPTLEEAKALATKLRAAVAAGADPSEAQVRVLEAIDEAAADRSRAKDKEQRWLEAVRSAARQMAEAEDTRPTVAVYAEASGWTVAEGVFEGRRTRGLLTATLDYWLLPDRDDTFLRFRYETGYEWSSPTVRRKQLFVSLSVRL
jgi:hypothetical protein